jgi:hypothetical protein
VSGRGGGGHDATPGCQAEEQGAAWHSNRGGVGAGPLRSLVEAKVKEELEGLTVVWRWCEEVTGGGRVRRMVTALCSGGVVR